MSNLCLTALNYLSNGLSVIPTQANKRAALREWKIYEVERMKSEDVEKCFREYNICSYEVAGIGIICGKISGGLEVVDVDCKNDTTGTLWDDLRRLIKDNLPDEVCKSFVVAETKNGGYHIYYRCSEIEGSMKLANKANEETLIETRGEGAYVIAPPSDGYRYIQNSPDKTAFITPEQRNILLNACRSFNEVADKPKLDYNPIRKLSNNKGNRLTPFEDYNERGVEDMLSVLENHGYKIKEKNSERVYILRPGETDSDHSGHYHIMTNRVIMFSTSTDFEANKGYSPSDVFALLECNNDKREAGKKLLNKGYGNKYSK